MSHTKDFFAGIDGGGTITKLVVGDQSGKVIFRCKGDGINYYGIGYDVAKQNIQKIFQCAAEHGYTEFDTAVVGLSALNDTVYGSSAKALSEVIPAKKVLIDSDTGIILHSMESRSVAVVISGTGSVCSMSASDGKTYQVGGYGHIVGDEGSSYFIGESGLRAALRALDGWAEPTRLTEELERYFLTDDKDKIIDCIYSGAEDKTKVANFSLIVEECSARGDAVAKKILQDNGKMLFLQFDALIKKAGEVPELLLLSGSVLKNSAVVRDAFFTLLAEKYPQIKTDTQDICPEERALKIALKNRREA